MRLILFFDLPMITKKERKVYSDFHKYLIKNGYLMLQYSIYSKIFNNVDALNNHIIILKRNVPSAGQIRIMSVTEKQFARIDIIVGGKSLHEEKISIEPFIIL
ncbi:MAG: CRISPR-associated endonuclease Cas2 [Bacilli bacterium]|nr:CRISPR-associated endonuclease Cas2 [Bacilli bacterium]